MPGCYGGRTVQDACNVLDPGKDPARNHEHVLDAAADTRNRASCQQPPPS